MEKVFVDYAKILKNSDFRVICLTSSDFPENKILDEAGIERITLNIKGHFDIFATIKLFSLIRKYSPNLLIAHNGRAFATINLLKKFFFIRTQILAVSHGGNPKRLLDFDYAIGVANHITNNLGKRGFKGMAKTIYNGIDVIDFTKKSRFGKTFTFGMMSRLAPEKNIEIAIKSFAKFVKKINKNSVLLIAGEGEEKESLLKLAKELRVDDRVQFIGWIKDKEKFFNDIDVFIQSSLNEPFGLTILESFNHKTLVIAAEVAGPKEIIKDGKNGFLFDPTNEETLFLKMQKACKEINHMKPITDSAFTDLQEKFSYEKLSESLVKFINLIIDFKQRN